MNASSENNNDQFESNKFFIRVFSLYCMTYNNNGYDWSTWWKTWVPDPAQKYVSSESDMPVKVNPIFGNGPLPPVEDNLCSVLMPFSDRFLSIYDDCIKPGLEHAGFRVIKADEIFSSPYVIEDIWKLINRSKFLVADVTGKNVNVFYELGIAHTVGKSVIIITQSKDDIPFDIQNIQHFTYRIATTEDKQKLRDHLETLAKKYK